MIHEDDPQGRLLSDTGLVSSNVRMNYRSNSTTMSSRGLQDEPCTTSTRVIELAIAYDSTFCAKFSTASNPEEATNNAIQTIINDVSMKYQQIGLCTKVQISHLEGYCIPSIDPYRELLLASGASIDANNPGACNALSKTANYWFNNREYVRRDAMHLFHNFQFPSSNNIIGCAYLRSLCRNFGFGVDRVGYTNNGILRNVLVAQ